MVVAQLRLHEWAYSYSSFSTLDIDVLIAFVPIHVQKKHSKLKNSIAAVHCLQETQKTVCITIFVNRRLWKVST